MNQELIEKALKLCGKTMEDMEVVSGVIYQQEELTYKFSIEKFCYYLLSPEFIGKYCEIDDIRPSQGIVIIGWAIYKYQSDNEEPLISLLSKIGKQ